MDFINDAIVSMDAFVSAYKPAAMFFSFPIEIRYLIKHFFFIFLNSFHDLAPITILYILLGLKEVVVVNMIMSPANVNLII